MKTTLLIQDNVQQVVFTPENEHEKSMLDLIDSQKVDTTLKVGNFSECKGGWIRYFYTPMGPYEDKDPNDSLMLILKPKENNKNKE